MYIFFLLYHCYIYQRDTRTYCQNSPAGDFQSKESLSEDTVSIEYDALSDRSPSNFPSLMAELLALRNVDWSSIVELKNL